MISGMRKMNGKATKQAPFRNLIASRLSSSSHSSWLFRISIIAIIITVIMLCYEFDLNSKLGLSFLADRSESYGVKVIPADLDDSALEQLPASTFSYLAMIDAGSSGCRAHVYRYGKLGNQEGPLYLLPQHNSKKVKPGLSSFSENPNNAGTSLEGLIEFIKTQVPEDDWRTTPIWLKATAGLRMLPPAKSDAVLNSVRQFLVSSENSPFLFRPSWAAIISGNEEGGFGWLAFNYLKRIVGPKKDTSSSKLPYVVIEMGGASAQVSQAALTKAEIAQIPISNRFQFDIEGESFVLYTHSYLGFGAEQAREGVNKYLLETKDSVAAVVSDPCINKGFVRQGPSKEAYDGPKGVNITGESDGDNCLAAVSHIYGKREQKDCPFAPSEVPMTFQCTLQPSFVTKSKNVLVFENFFYMSSALAVKSTEQASSGTFPLITSPENIKEASKSFCEKDWTTSQAEYPKDKQSKENNLKMCFISSYAYSFLVDGLGFEPSKAITTQKEVGEGVEIEWALGAAYKEASDFIKRTNLRPT